MVATGASLQHNLAVAACQAPGGRRPSAAWADHPAGPRAPPTIMTGMASSDIDRLDAPACPFLGLAADRHSRFTYPHPGHRCFATKHPATSDAGRQATFCLSLDFTTCDRYPARPASDAPGVATPGTTMIHVLRAGDSLAKIAAMYGLTVEQIAMANGLRVNRAGADGTRLVIPLETRAASDRDPDQSQRRKGRSG